MERPVCNPFSNKQQQRLMLEGSDSTSHGCRKLCNRMLWQLAGDCHALHPSFPMSYQCWCMLLGLFPGLEALVMTPNGMASSFLACCSVTTSCRHRSATDGNMSAMSRTDQVKTNILVYYIWCHHMICVWLQLIPKHAQPERCFQMVESKCDDCCPPSMFGNTKDSHSLYDK